MKHTSLETIRQAALDLDQKLIEQLKDTGFITATDQLGPLCGKSTSYYSCMKRKHKGLHIGSLTFLAAYISNLLNNEGDLREALPLRQALKAVNETITAKCALREQELYLQQHNIKWVQQMLRDRLIQQAHPHED